MRKIREVLANPKQRRIAVFFGAAHMPGIEASLVTGAAAGAPAGAISDFQVMPATW
jgi:hypothetical protein